MFKPKTKHGRDVHSYVSGVLSGKIVAGKLLIASCERYVDDVKHAKRRGFVFNEQQAAGAIDFFPLLKLSDGEFAGQPFELQPWQKMIMWNLFGWRRIADGLRRFRDAFISVARGNGKSPMAAALGLLLFCFDDPIEARAEVVVVATKKDQAKIVFNEASRQVRSSPSLRRMIEVRTGNLFFALNDSKFEPLGSDSDNQDGLVLHAAIRDELHAWREQHRGLYEKIETAMGKRRQPLAITITTAGNDRSTLWREQYEFSAKVATRTIEADQHYSAIWEIDDDDDPLDEAVWPKANPNLGISVRVDALQDMARKAKDVPTTRLTFKRYHGNRRTESKAKAFPLELWKKGNRPVIAKPGDTAFAGLDLGWRDDLASLSLIVQRQNGGFDCLSWSWICEECGRDLQAEPWAGWIAAGDLIVTDGNTTDDKAIVAKVRELRETYDLQSVAIDPNNARSMGNVLVNDLGLTVYEFFQTCRKYNEPVREFLRQLADKKIAHGGNPLLQWAASNMVLKNDSLDNVMPAKGDSSEKIDPIVALLMAFSEALFAERDGPSPYDTEGGGVVLL